MNNLVSFEKLKSDYFLVRILEYLPKKKALEIMKNNKRTDVRQISAKVNRDTYEKFTEICKLNGMSNNSCLNMIIAEFVREKSHLLSE